MYLYSKLFSEKLISLKLFHIGFNYLINHF